MHLRLAHSHGRSFTLPPEVQITKGMHSAATLLSLICVCSNYPQIVARLTSILVDCDADKPCLFVSSLYHWKMYG